MELDRFDEHLQDLVTNNDWVADPLLSSAAIARSTTHIVYSRMKFETPVSAGA